MFSISLKDSKITYIPCKKKRKKTKKKKEQLKKSRTKITIVKTYRRRWIYHFDVGKEKIVDKFKRLC